VSAIVFLNDEFVARERARIAVDDRGFLFGDGVYEVTRAVDGVLFEWDAHLRRLRDGLTGLEMGAGVAERTETLLGMAQELLARNDLSDGSAIVYVQVTRGAACRTHQFPPPGTPPTVYMSATAFAPAPAGQAEGVAAITQPDLRWGRCDLKTVNLLPNVLAKQHAVEAGAAEALLVREGVLTEGSHSNVFALIGGMLRTHPASPRILGGITRRIVLRLAEEAGVPVEETPIRMTELGAAEEIFLTGTTTDVMPIRQIDGRPVGTGRPGSVTRMLQDAYAATMQRAMDPARSLVG
jgi:D-alanine transaminase